LADWGAESLANWKLINLVFHLPVEQFPEGTFVAVAKLVLLDLSGTPSKLPPPPALVEMPNLRELHLR